MSTGSSVETAGTTVQGEPYNPSLQRMHSGHSYGGGGGPLSENTPTLNHLLQSSPDPRHKLPGAGGGESVATSSAPSSLSSSSYGRDDYPPPHPTSGPPPPSGNMGMKGPEPPSYDPSAMQSGYPVPHQHTHHHTAWNPHVRGGPGHQYMYPPQGPGPGSAMYGSQPGGNSDMSQGRRPAMGGMSGPYPPQQGGQYMGQQMAMGGPGGGPQRFMMAGQMPNQMYGHPQSQMYMPPSSQPPAPSVSPAGRPPTPQQPQLQQMQNMISNSPKQPSPAPSISSDHGSTHSSKPGDEGPDMKIEINSQDELGDSRNSAGHRPVPSPVGSTGSRSNTPASIPGTQSGSPMPIRPPSGQLDGQNRMTQSPMATQGYNPQMMPPPNNMGFMPNSGKMPSHYPPYNAQYPQGNFNRQQTGMGGMSSPGNMSGGHMPGGYHSSQQSMYPNGPSPQMQGYGNMPPMNRNMPHSAGSYGPSPGSYPPPGNNMMGAGQYPGYNSHMTPHGMQPANSMPPGSIAGPMAPSGGQMPPNMGGQQPQQQQQQQPTQQPQQQAGTGAGGPMMPQHGGAPPMNKAAQAAQAALMAAANSVNPRMPHNSRGSMSPSRGMFSQGGGGPLAQMNSMSNSPNLGSPSLNSMSNAVEQLTRTSNMAGAGSTPSPGLPKSNGPVSLSSSSSAGGHLSSASPLSTNTVDGHDSSRPNSTTAVHQTDLLPTGGDTTSSESSSGMPSDSTSVDSGFHSSSDQGDKTSDSIMGGNSTGGMATQSPPLSASQQQQQQQQQQQHHQNGEAGRPVENISPPSSSSSSRPPIPDPKMPYNMNEGGAGGFPMPATSLSSTMAPMPAVDHCVTTTASLGHITPVTQSIASPVTSVSTSQAQPPHPMHGMPPGQHMMGGGGAPGPHHPHGMHGMMANGMMPNAPPPPHMGGPPHGQPQMPPHHVPPGMMPHPNMGGPNMNMSQNGPMMGHGPPHGPMMGHGPGGQMMGPNGPMMPPGSMGNSMGHMGGQMPPQQQQQQQAPPSQQQHHPSMPNSHPDEPPEKKKKGKDMESQIISRAGFPGHAFSEEPNSPGVPKSASDISKLFEMGPEPDRRPFLERVLSFQEESGNPITAMPAISKTPLDLYKLYFSVREKGGFEEVTQHKKWREICTVVNIGTSASAAFTLKKNYIRYLLNYECKFDRGGVNPQPILAQMEAQLAHKREAKSKRAPSPGSNSNDAFRPPSVPNNQMDNYPPGMPPPYGQNPDGSMPPNMMMGGPNMMGNMPPNMMGGPPSQGMMGGPNMMGGANMMGGVPPPHGMMPGGPPHGPGGYGSPMMPHSQPGPGHPGGPQQPSPGMNSSGPVPTPPQGGPTPSSASSTPPVITPDSVSVQDPFADEPNFTRAGSSQQGSAGGPPLPASSSTSSTSSSSMPSSSSSGAYPASQPPSGATSTPRSNTAAPSSHPIDGPTQTSTTPGAQFPFGQQFDHPDRFDQSSPNLRHAAPPNSGMATPSQQPSGDGMYPQPRFPGPPQQMVGMRPPQGEGPPSQYPAYPGQAPSFPNSQYPGGYSGVPPGPYPGPRPPPPSGGGAMYGTPRHRYPDGASHGQDAGREGQWSPLPRQRMPQGSPGYMPPGPPSTPPMGNYGRPAGHRNSPQARSESGRYTSNQKGPKTTYASLTPAPLSKKELVFPPDSVEGVSCASMKRRRLNHKDLGTGFSNLPSRPSQGKRRAPFEAWRLMLSLKSGQLAESTWALDTLNILLYDDSTHAYFALSNLKGLLEVLTEHLRHCLMQMFSNFHDLEEGQSRQPRRPKGKRYLSMSKRSSLLKECADASMEDLEDSDRKCRTNEERSKMDLDAAEEIGASLRLPGTNYTTVSRKGLPVRLDHNPSDSSVLESKDWDVYTRFETRKEHWLLGKGDITDHILTHFESESTNEFLSGVFKRKRTRFEEDEEEEEEEEEDCEIGEVREAEAASGFNGKWCKKGSEGWKSKMADERGGDNSLSSSICGAINSHSASSASDFKSEPVDSVGERGVSDVSVDDSQKANDRCKDTLNSHHSHSKLCNGESSEASIPDLGIVKTECVEEGMTIKSKASESDAIVDVDNEIKEGVNCGGKETKGENCDKEKVMEGDEKECLATKSGKKEGEEVSVSGKPVENGDMDEPKLSPMVNHKEDEESKFCNGLNGRDTSCSDKDKEEDEDDSSPPVLKAECEDLDDTQGSTLPLSSTLNGNDDSMDVDFTEASVAGEASQEGNKNEKKEKASEECVSDNVKSKDEEESVKNESIMMDSSEKEVDATLNESFVSETEEMSASFVTDLLKEEENVEEEAFQRDDPPLCVTQESRDELGRRCVCISNIIRSLSCVPGNEARICKHPGIMRILGRLLLLHHVHLPRAAPRRLPGSYVDEEIEAEEEREEPPRVCDDDHWWWDYLDQLRENALVILANICSHLMLGNFPEQLCFPLLEGLLHWVVCPSSSARDPLPTLSPSSVLSPQRLVLEALCKLCIHETNVDLLLATPPMKRLLEFFNVLVRLLADRNSQITREFSIVLLSLLVQGDSSVARAIALQHPCVPLLVDFLETAEQNALAIANQQGLSALQSNPESMGTSLDMLRRAASILLHIARVPDNRKMFIPQQNRLLNLVMSEILDQSVANSLSEVLFECSQSS